ncbi:poly-gamma-glutamate hydrolase family protein [Sphingopyxis sp.]|uniref:poly-gamma-glutamate hydrolase family protein n=1 Tax=Sphingopyxis sp. TaxID=1908224 RepID=UPI002B476DAF|nr:poly-gamma-glutamate hydrolase family protein [Sphingopyxis sp.]HJS10004.1 poly-gamma-glutamate hydrolase family protein [Sphingopyxis sp.]
MVDKYSNFAELAANETAEVDYRIRAENRGTPVVIIAPHGGRIEPGTLEIAATIAGDALSFYAFEALRASGKRGSLHITSTRFDEPQALALVGAAQKAIAIHGRADNGDPVTVGVGGRDTALRDAIVAALTAAGFDAVPVTHGGLAGRDAANICNRGATGAGAQLELPRTLRIQLSTKPMRLAAFCNAVRSAAVAGEASLV